MSRDLINPLLLLEREREAPSLEDLETLQLLNPTGLDPFAALLAHEIDER